MTLTYTQLFYKYTEAKWQAMRRSTLLQPGTMYSLGAGLIYNSIVFLSWTVTSFLCHYFAKDFLTVSIQSTPTSPQLALCTSLSNAALVTCAQIATCFSTVTVNHSDNTGQLRSLRVTHILATLATNLSLSLMFASSSMAIKLAEPVTTAIIQYCIQGAPMTPLTAASIPVIVGGAIAFSGNPLVDAHLSLGAGFAFGSNILLAFRNTTIKKMEARSKHVFTFKVQRSKVPIVFFVLGCGILLPAYSRGESVLSGRVLHALAACVTSSVFHVTYSYVSMALVLSQMSVVSHAVVNIMKRVFVVLLLYSVGRRSASVYNSLGLVICTLGLFVYALEKQQKIAAAGLTRKMVWVLLVGLPCAVLVFWGHDHRAASSEIPWFKTADRDGFSLRSKTLSDPTKLGNGNDSPLSNNPAASSLFRPHPLMEHTFGSDSFKPPNLEDLKPELDGYLSNESAEIKQFLNRKLIRDPFNSNYLSKKLRSSLEVIREAQRVHYSMFSDVIGKYKYCMLLDIAEFENKGDPAITVGEMYYLLRSSLEVLYYCSYDQCTHNELTKAQTMAGHYSPQELVVLIHGGGSIIGYAERDEMRFKILKLFRGFPLFIFPQSVWARNLTSHHFKECQKHYCCNENLTFVLRDQTSFSMAQKFFNGTTRLLMAPDMAFHIGPVKRFMSPVFDILWIKRVDQETDTHSRNLTLFPSHLRVHVTDWHQFISPRAGSGMEHAFYITVMGLFFVQRGRVVITDRLHGHIFSTLLDIPHVLVDNKAKKLSVYHNTWTQGLTNTRFTDNDQEAFRLATELLKDYDSVLPPRIPFLQPPKFPVNATFYLPDSSYP